MIDQVAMEAKIDDNNPNFNFMLGSKVRMKVAIPLKSLIQACRHYNKTLVMICPLDHTSTDDLSKATVAFDTRTAQDVFFNLCDIIVHLKRKAYKPCKTIEEFLCDTAYVFDYPHETAIPLKDKGNVKFNKKLDNNGGLINLLFQIYQK